MFIPHHRPWGERPAPAGVRWALLALAMLCLLPAAGPAAAQTHDEVRMFIERTSELLERAERAVSESDSERGRRLLAEALGMHARSRQLLDGGRPVLALGASRRARELGENATRLAVRGQGFAERARLRLERALELRDAVRERAREQDSRAAMRFVDESDRQLERAREQYVQKNFEIAFSLAESAETLLARAGRLLFEQGEAPRLQRELELSAELVARARERAAAADDRAARDLAARAEAQLERARDALAHGEPMAALRAAHQARQLAVQAEERARAEPDPAAVRRQIESWDQRFASAAPRLRERSNPRVLAALDRAARRRDEAVHQLDAGRLEEALRQIKIAHDELRRAEEIGQ